MKRNLKPMRSRPEVSDEEIQSFMDFGKLLAERERLLSARRKTRLLRGGSAAILGVATLAIVWFSMHESNDNAAGSRSANTVQSETPTPAVTQEEAKPEMNGAVPEETPRKDRRDESIAKPAISQQDAPTQTARDAVYIQATPVDGYPALYQYFDNALVYPPEAVADSIEGIVTVIFTIGVDGEPRDIRIENSLGKAFDDQAINVIEKMPAWKPAYLNGAPVPSKISVPLTFDLKHQDNN